MGFATNGCSVGAMWPSDVHSPSPCPPQQCWRPSPGGAVPSWSICTALPHSDVPARSGARGEQVGPGLLEVSVHGRSVARRCIVHFPRLTRRIRTYRMEDLALSTSQWTCGEKAKRPQLPGSGEIRPRLGGGANSAPGVPGVRTARSTSWLMNQSPACYSIAVCARPRLQQHLYRRMACIRITQLSN